MNACLKKMAINIVMDLIIIVLFSGAFICCCCCCCSKLSELVDLLEHAQQRFLAVTQNVTTGKLFTATFLMCKQTLTVCNLCKSVMRLVHLHAESCKRSWCELPHCKEMKEQILKRAHGRGLRKKQPDLRKQLLMMTITRAGVKKSLEEVANIKKL